MQQLLRAVFWSAVVIVFTLLVLPHPPTFMIKSDKIQHMLAFIALSTLGVCAYPRHIWRVLFGLFAFGAVTELIQTIPFLHRDADVLDWLADATATTVALLIVLGARRLAARS